MCKGNGRGEHSQDKPWGVIRIMRKWCAEVWKVCALRDTGAKEAVLAGNSGLLLKGVPAIFWIEKYLLCQKTRVHI